jgi:hypothetical protein
MADEVEFTKPTTQLDLERRQAIERGDEEAPGSEARSFEVEGNDTSGYIGTSPEYMNYADETSKPFLAEDDSPEAVIEQRVMDFQNAEKTNVTTEEETPPQEEKPQTTSRRSTSTVSEAPKES